MARPPLMVASVGGVTPPRTELICCSTHAITSVMLKRRRNAWKPPQTAVGERGVMPEPTELLVSSWYAAACVVLECRRARSRPPLAALNEGGVAPPRVELIVLLGSASCASARVALERSQYEAAWQLFTRVGARVALKERTKNSGHDRLAIGEKAKE